MKVCSFELTAAEDAARISETLVGPSVTSQNAERYEVTVDTMRKPAEPKPDFVECAIVELLRIAQCHGITPADVIQLLDSGMHISDFLAALTPLANSNDSIDCDS